MRYFITGATGFVGGGVAKRLLDSGHDLVALARTPAKADWLAKRGATIVQGDLADKESMREAMRGCDGVYHIAGWYKIGQPSPDAYAANVEGTRNILELMRDLKIPKGVYSSSITVNGDTKGILATEDYYFDPHNHKFLNLYHETKWRAQYEVAMPMIEQGLPLVIVQPDVVYGIGDTSDFQVLLDAYLQGKLPAIVTGIKYTWSHVDDIANGHVLAMEKGKIGERYILAGDAISLDEAFDIFESITGISAPKTRIPHQITALMLPIVRLIHKFRPLGSRYHPEAMQMLSGVTMMGDASKAKAALGYTSRPFADGVREMLAHHMDVLGITQTIGDVDIATTR